MSTDRTVALASARGACGASPTSAAALRWHWCWVPRRRERASSRSSTSTKGIVTRSVVALAVRKGNPKNIRGWASRLTLRLIALGYLAALLAIPVAMVFYKTFEGGIAPAWEAVTTPPAQHAFF
jgi:hypothetical protein